MRVHVIPASDAYGRKHYTDTIQLKVSKSKIKNFVKDREITNLITEESYAVWGVKKGKSNINHTKWLRMERGDICLFYRDKKFFSAGKVLCKFENYEFSKDLWGDIPRNSDIDPEETWEDMFLLDEIKKINIPLEIFNNLMGYKEGNIIQGYNNYEESISELIVDEFDLSNWQTSSLYAPSSFGLVFGHIPGISTGDIFESRKELSELKLHTPTMAGIWGRESEGSCSIVLSGGYEDDIDNLDYILYTGQGGQDAPGGKQISDQEFSKGNKGLQLSCEYGLPVRVTRGHQVQYGPESGYRYDGLYYVTSYERIIGKSGHYICRFHLESELSISDLEKKLDENLPENYKTAHRTVTTINKINRNIKLREKIKEIYGHKCQVCNVYLRKPHGAIAIGAHIKGLGQPHNGPDVLSNMLCLCPNHHDQFDALAFYIDPETFDIKGLDGHEEVKLTISNNHKIDKEFLEYHKNQYEKKTN